MSIKIADAVAAYANAAKSAVTGAAPSSGGAAGGSSFADLVNNAAGEAVGALQKSESTSLQAVTGKADLTEVVTAVSNAEVTLQTVAALRDRVVSAYQSILQMPI
jgi:flagellar hook-basal body complex protein FliE